MGKAYHKHWAFFLTGIVLSSLLIIFWYLNQHYLALEKGRVALLLESPLLTFGLIIFGAFISSFLSGEYGIKTPVTYEPLVFSFIGGILMGVGAVIASMSVHSVVLFNLAGIFNLTAFMITKGWVYVIFMILGGLVGSRLFLHLILKTNHFKKDFFIPKMFMNKRLQTATFFILLLLFIIFTVSVWLFSPLSQNEKNGFVAAVILLILFGVVVERGTICMSSMLKEWFIAKSSYVWRNVLFTIMCLAFLYQLGLGLSIYSPIEMEKNIPSLSLLIIGSFMMGFGFIFADGCFIGSLWKAGQGNIINIAGIFGMLIGMGASQYAANNFISDKKLLAPGLQIPNYLSDIANPLVFLFIVWLGGIILLAIFKPKFYRY